MEEITKYNRIKAALAEAGKTNRELADFMGVHTTTVSDWCTNKNQPYVQDFYRIAEFLQINVRLLFLPTYWNTRPNGHASEDEPVFKKPAHSKKKAKSKKKSRK
jgi:putative transcriptional regulator